MHDPRRIMPNANNNTIPLSIQRGEQTRETVFKPAISRIAPYGCTVACLPVRQAHYVADRGTKMTQKNHKTLKTNKITSFPLPVLLQNRKESG